MATSKRKRAASDEHASDAKAPTPTPVSEAEPKGLVRLREPVEFPGTTEGNRPAQRIVEIEVLSERRIERCEDRLLVVERELHTLSVAEQTKEKLSTSASDERHRRINVWVAVLGVIVALLVGVAATWATLRAASPPPTPARLSK